MKGYDILLPAFDLVCDKVNNAFLRLIGENFEQKAFQEIFSRCKNKDKITFTGWLEQDGVLEELIKADSFVLSSRVEAQPISILEALSTGLPVVCTEVVPEAIVSDKEGIRVPVENVEALADGMLRMIAERNKFDEKAISERIASVAGPDAVTKSIIAIYEKVLQSRL